MLKTALAPTDDRKTALRAAPVAVSVLKGVGEFAGDLTAGISISFEPGALDWGKVEQVEAGPTIAVLPEEPTAKPVLELPAGTEESKESKEH